ncbi:MAG: sigma-70 family RNA polymerase sigma factor [Synergistaceae bacterium]|nr:sigma-70 family RNA polymerase sigma factor [Synergistaceae bacterium]
MTEKTDRPSLNPLEEKELWDKIQLGDEGSRERIILAYRPMVYWLAKKFRTLYGTYPDLIQEGMVGLIFAVDSFEPERSNRFITYAYYKIKGRMANFLSRVESKAPMPVDDEYLERSENFEEDLDLMEWSVSLGEGIDKLPERERDILVSLVVEGRRAADVAGEHGVGVSHIYRLQRRAIAKLKSLFMSGNATSDA